MAENPYEAPQESSEPELREYPPWVHYVAASAAVIPIATASVLVKEIYDRWQESTFSHYQAIGLLIAAGACAAVGAVCTVFVARLRRR